MATFLLAASVLLLVPASAQITDSIDWRSYLTRHDPIWKWGPPNCTTGYTLYPNTLPTKGGENCGAFECTSRATCVEESARMCDACLQCEAFALNPAWRNGTTPQIFTTGFNTPNNTGWTMYSKGGPVLRNHTSCSAGEGVTLWEDSAFYGNGLMGGLVMLDGQDPHHTVRLQVGRADIADQRDAGTPHATGALMFDKPRLPVGSLGLTLKGTITSGFMRIHLENATVVGSITTTLGSLTFQLAAHRTEMAILLAWNASGGEAMDPSTGEGSGASLDFVPIPGNSTRHNPPPSYSPNPPFTCSGSPWGGSTQVCTQSLLSGGDYATAISTRPLPDADGRQRGAALTVLYTAFDAPSPTSGATAAALVGRLATQGSASSSALAALWATHSAAWLTWYPASFISIGDSVMEGTYIMQQYKYGSAAREGGPAMDLMGPWWQVSGWEAFWPDMNVPTQYAALATARRFDLLGTWTWWVSYALREGGPLRTNVVNSSGSTIPDTIGFGSIFSFDLVSPMPIEPGQQLGNPTWLALPLHQHATFTANTTALEGIVYPYLRGCVNMYLGFAVFNASDGFYHLPPTASPEYPYPPPDTRPGPDTHYDLALFSWGLRTLLNITAALGISDPLQTTWEHTLAHLTPFPTNENGYMVDAVHGFDVSHRHFSHLFAIYPLHLAPWEDVDGGSDATRALITTSLDRWTGLTCVGGHCPNGFTFDGSSSISASIPSRGPAAAGNISGFITSGLMHASTLYSEGRQPCMESPVAAAASLQEMMLQSWGGRVRVFPSATAWLGGGGGGQGAVFHRLGAEGGFAVSAVLGATLGEVEWVGVEAVDYTGGGGGGGERTIILSAPGLGPAADVSTVPSGVSVRDVPGGIAFSVAVGSTVVVFPKANPSDFTVAALPGNSSGFNYWGKH